MEVHPLLGQLDSLLAGESVVGGRGMSSPPSSGISPGMRDGSAHVLRCLKVWYDLPSDVFHTAVANIDTFLAKMKVNISSGFFWWKFWHIFPLKKFPSFKVYLDSCRKKNIFISFISAIKAKLRKAMLKLLMLFSIKGKQCWCAAIRQLCNCCMWSNSMLVHVPILDNAIFEKK